MYSPIFMFGCLLLAVGVSAQGDCNFSMPFHQVLSAPEGVQTIDDEDGSRQIKATVFNSADCGLSPNFPSGSPPRRSNPEMTIFSGDSNNPGDCVAKLNGGVYSLDSFQAMVVETNGWPLNDLSFDIMDLDVIPDAAREGAAVFGLRNGGLVLPNIILPPETKLKTLSFSMPSTSNTQLGLDLGSTTIPGVFVRDPGNFACPGMREKSPLCLVTVSFPAPVDTLVVMYFLEENGPVRGRPLIFLTPLTTACGCRCREYNPGTRQITVPVPGGSGECTTREASGPKIECDVLGGRWCLKEPKSEYVLTGGTLPSGNLGCTGKAGTKFSVQQEFNPDPNFGGNA